jgi:diguanylate cyclase (GGDEF)-like protein
MTAVFLDIDRFKNFNDAWGHHTGDRVIRLLAGLLRKCTDRPLDFFCRWGGEEFLILLPETGIQGGIALARRIRKSLSGVHLENGGGKLPCVTISVGIASTEDHPAVSLRELIERSDRMMLEAKASGRNRVFSEGIGEDVDAPG